MVISIESREEGKLIRNFLLSKEFKEFLKSCKWSNFRIDTGIFKYLKENFVKNLNKKRDF